MKDSPEPLSLSRVRHCVIVLAVLVFGHPPSFKTRMLTLFTVGIRSVFTSFTLDCA